MGILQNLDRLKKDGLIGRAVNDGRRPGVSRAVREADMREVKQVRPHVDGTTRYEGGAIRKSGARDIDCARLVGGVEAKAAAGRVEAHALEKKTARDLDRFIGGDHRRIERQLAILVAVDNNRTVEKMSELRVGDGKEGE